MGPPIVRIQRDGLLKKGNRLGKIIGCVATIMAPALEEGIIGCDVARLPGGDVLLLTRCQSHGQSGDDPLGDFVLQRKDITDALIEKTIHQPIHWKIPNDYKNTMNAINEGRPVVDYAPRTAVSKCILDLAKTLVPQDEQQKKSKWKLF